MHPELLQLLLAVGIGATVLAVSALARRLPVPVPILQLLAGLALGFVPGLAVPSLDPDVVFLVFLPPVLWAAAYFTSLRDFRRNLRPIGLLAIGLVIVTTVAVAVAARALFPGMPWAAAVALGAIVSPPDAVAAEAIIKRLPVPHRVVTVLEGESLVNDASALTLYRTAVAAAVTGSFSAGEATVRFFIDAGVGVLVGVAVGWLLVAVSRRTDDTLAEVLLTLLGPYLAWVIAELLHASAVLAAVAGGLYVRQHFSTVVSAASRLQARAVWQMLVFVLNALIFLLLGLSAGDLVRSLEPGTGSRVLGAGLAISAVCIVTRLAWVPLATLLPRWLSPSLARRDPLPPAKHTFLVAWTSMRGIVSLASALALPLALADGTPFPFRTEILLVTMLVILVTLVAQGLTLAPIIRAFAFPPETAHHEEERVARAEAVRHALDRLEDLRHEPWVHAEHVETLGAQYRRKVQVVSELAHTEGAAAEDAAARRRLRWETIDAERRALVRLRNEGVIGDEVLHELERELDVEAMRIGMGEAR
ncbi:MAG: Na+/H+ antiporter [Gemmatimonadales bacterium]|nr:Na+/H+ antiporter [Gemmatimonadales bacterium]